MIVVRKKRPPGDGFPPNPRASGHHIWKIGGTTYVLRWVAHEQMWSCGLKNFTPADLAGHVCLGPAWVEVSATREVA